MNIEKYSLGQLRELRDRMCGEMSESVEKLYDEDGDEIAPNGGVEFLNYLCEMRSGWAIKWETINRMFQDDDSCVENLDPMQWKDFRMVIERCGELERLEITKLKNR